MEIEALTSILMDDLTQLPQGSGDGIPNARSVCYQIEIRARGDDREEEFSEDDDDVFSSDDDDDEVEEANA